MKIGNLVLNECSGVVARMCMVTPADAAELLKLNTHNRKESASCIEKYAVEMQHGEWLPTAAGIGIDETNTLSDGQNRLRACVNSGVSVPMLIVCGLPKAAQGKMDRHNKRRLSSSLFLSGSIPTEDRRGVEVATFLARRLYGKGSLVADCVVAECYTIHAASIAEIGKMFHSNEKGTSQVGVRAAMVLAHEVHPAKALEFCALIKQELHSRADHPAFRLRKVLNGDTCTRRSSTAGNGGGQQSWAFVKTLYAFNAYREGRYITSVLDSDKVSE